VELTVATAQQGQGFGRTLNDLLADEARQRGKRRKLVGTANRNLDTITFYLW